jgi:hypothetical protein
MTPQVLAPSLDTSAPSWRGLNPVKVDDAKSHGAVLYTHDAKAHGVVPCTHDAKGHGAVLPHLVAPRFVPPPIGLFFPLLYPTPCPAHRHPPPSRSAVSPDPPPPAHHATGQIRPAVSLPRPARPSPPRATVRPSPLPSLCMFVFICIHT